MRFLFTLLLIFFITGCGVSQPAPIVEGWQQPAAKNSGYVVQQGDTLYSIAWAFNMDFRDLARINYLSAPYAVKTGQRLRMAQFKAPVLVPLPQSTSVPNIPITPKILNKQTLPSPTAKIIALPTIKSTSKNLNRVYSKSNSPVKIKQQANVLKENITKRSSPYRLVAVKGWRFPAEGRIIHGFSMAAGGTRGIEIAGRLGEPVVASAGGKVVYSGSGLRGYGNLIIVKHNDTFLSAYAYNKKLLVKEGMNVTAGQKIALMGVNNAGQARLHFEIRRNGKPIDPMKLVG